MSDLRNLYQEVVVDHSRSPRNFGRLAAANRSAEGFNPLCGDRLTLYLRIRDGVIEDASFEGSGCAIFTASASLMTETLKGKTEAQARALFSDFHALVTAVPERAGVPMGKLEVLAGVREFPARVKCATLAWHTMQAALENSGRPVSTE
ncbi:MULTISPECIES: Fe-S cluster assembly sulfur transfer protein SufU [unclassified Cupriavidus]|uniref:Fe-S cluster assembly sulfur transfer protein SufU n=1 Tax=unclassified Cupriavidus TaxID=2640874 RepID=UPI001AE3699F|nr:MULTISPECIES: SUF system NifU family Fe-S cluster assembly protein [unclassified Cupriavidus]MBP0632352.1 SUF system NifU family Fe-S cluster assembly protein [Cupriavidus sp. AcVe19-1a]MBP0639764.1 SUF system NifU family Fe-S cluster assembly protein [Cupriavidus sp. AcVe19-6a]